MVLVVLIVLRFRTLHWLPFCVFCLGLLRIWVFVVSLLDCV